MLNGIDSVFQKQLEDSDKDYSSLLIEVWKQQIKAYVDWFVVKYTNLMRKRCAIAARVVGNKQSAEDLFSECVLECYRASGRFNVEKGDDLKKFLIASIWNFPFKKNIRRRYSNPQNLEVYDLNSVASNKDISASAEATKLDSILKGLETWEKQLLHCKAGLGMTNVEIGKLLGCGESTVRYRLQIIIGKLKIKGVLEDAL